MVPPPSYRPNCKSLRFRAGLKREQKQQIRETIVWGLSARATPHDFPKHKTNMVEIIPVKVRRNASGKDYATYEVECPATGGTVSTKACKECDHCRLFLGESVKCSYRQDREREKKPFVHPVHIL